MGCGSSTATEPVEIDKKRPAPINVEEVSPCRPITIYLERERERRTPHCRDHGKHTTTNMPTHFDGPSVTSSATDLTHCRCSPFFHSYLAVSKQSPRWHEARSSQPNTGSTAGTGGSSTTMTSARQGALAELKEMSPAEVRTSGMFAFVACLPACLGVCVYVYVALARSLPHCLLQ